VGSSGGARQVIEEAIERAKEEIAPTQPVPGVEHAYWCRLGAKEFVRWVRGEDEDEFFNAFARIYAARESDLEEGARFVGAFALGVVIIARAPGYAGSLQDFLFGSITGIPASDVPVVMGGALFVLLMLFLAHRPIVAVTLDRESARAAGVHVLAADLSLYVAVALAVVISVQTIGNLNTCKNKCAGYSPQSLESM